MVSSKRYVGRLRIPWFDSRMDGDGYKYLHDVENNRRRYCYVSFGVDMPVSVSTCRKNHKLFWRSILSTIDNDPNLHQWVEIINHLILFHYLASFEIDVFPWNRTQYPLHPNILPTHTATPEMLAGLPYVNACLIIWTLNNFCTSCCSTDSVLLLLLLLLLSDSNCTVV